jgi:hypothetical protein
MLLLILKLGLLAQAHGDSPAESIQQSAGLSNLPQNSFCPGEAAICLLFYICYVCIPNLAFFSPALGEKI